jgi:hypothetical protein
MELNFSFLPKTPGRSANEPSASRSDFGRPTEVNAEGKFVGEARNDGKDAFLSGETHAFSSAVRRVLVDKFGLRSFRTNQLQAINSALLGKEPIAAYLKLCFRVP